MDSLTTAKRDSMVQSRSSNVQKYYNSPPKYIEATEVNSAIDTCDNHR